MATIEGLVRDGLAVIPERDAAVELPLSDAGNAELFAKLYRNSVRFDHARQRWLVWEGHRWRPDASGEVQRLAVRAVRCRFHAAADLPDDMRRALARFAIASESAPRINGMLSLAKSARPIADAGTGWDSDPDLLGVPNGVVDLRTGELRDGRPEDKITMQAGVAYDPTATCPRWERFVWEIFDGREELVAFIHRAVGYSFTGHVTEDKLFFDYGKGENGKTTFVEDGLLAVAGDYGHSMAAAALLEERRGAHSTDLADLEGKRFVAVTELPVAKLNEARIKALTGGGTITARHMRQDNRTFQSTHKLWADANDYPRVADDSPGFWRRMAVIPFDVSFKGRADARLAETLHAEAPGILAWVVRGAVAWHHGGLGTLPAAVIAATTDFREETDPLAEFINDYLVEQPGGWESVADLYRSYGTWAVQAGVPEREKLTRDWFARRMAKRYNRRKSGGTRGFDGIAFKTPVPQSGSLAAMALESR